MKKSPQKKDCKFRFNEECLKLGRYCRDHKCDNPIIEKSPQKNKESYEYEVIDYFEDGVLVKREINGKETPLPTLFSPKLPCVLWDKKMDYKDAKKMFGRL